MFGTLSGSFLIAQMVSTEMSLWFEQIADDTPLSTYAGLIKEADFLTHPVTFNKSSGLLITGNPDLFVQTELGRRFVCIFGSPNSDEIVLVRGSRIVYPEFLPDPKLDEYHRFNCGFYTEVAKFALAWLLCTDK